MKRLTTKKLYGKREMVCRFEDCDTTEEYCPDLNTNKCDCLQEVLNRLAEYEDMEEQGRLVKLPCAVGDKYFEIETHFYGEREKCEKCQYFHEGDDMFRDDPCCFYSDSHDDKEPLECMEISEKVFGSIDYIVFHMERKSFGKTIFLTREQAEQSLQKMKQEQP